MAARRRARCGWFAVLVVAACAAAPPMPDPAPTHPASPDAAEAPPVAASTTLTMPTRMPKAATPKATGGSDKPRGH